VSLALDRHERRAARDDEVLFGGLKLMRHCEEATADEAIK
jgi:hypothetical protein